MTRSAFSLSLLAAVATPEFFDADDDARRVILAAAGYPNRLCPRLVRSARRYAKAQRERDRVIGRIAAAEIAQADRWE